MEHDLTTMATSMTSIEDSRINNDKEEEILEEDTFYNPSFYNLQEEFRKYSRMLQKGEVDKRVLFRIGRINHFWENLQEAFRYYNMALEIDGDYGEVHYNLGNIYYEQNNLEKAKKHYIRAIKTKENDIYALNALGKTCFGLKEFENSEKYHSLALKCNPGDVYALRGLGNIYLTKKNFGEALNYYYKAIDINPSDGVSLYNIGLVHLLSGRTENAEKHFAECLEKNYFFGFYFGLGLCCYRQGKKNEAFKNFRIGLTMPQQTELDFKFKDKIEDQDWNILESEFYFCKGNAHYSAGNLADAIKELEKTVTLNPEFSQVHNFLGKLYLKKGDFASALKHYEHILRLEPENIDVEREVCVLGLAMNPENVNTMIRLHHIYWMQEDFAREIDTLEKIVKLTTEPLYFYKLGCAYLSDNQKVKADEAFTRLLSPEKKEDLGHTGFALLYASKKDFPRALNSIEKALSIEKKSEYFLEAGNIYREYGDSDKALECYYEAFKLNPYSRLIYRYLVDCLLESKGREKAEKIIGEYSRSQGYDLLLTEFYIRLKEYKKAGKCLFKFDVNMKKREIAHLYLGICYQEEGFYECALEAFQSSANSEELKGESYGRMALIYQEIGNIARAKNMVSRALYYSRYIEPVVRYKISMLLWELDMKKELEEFLDKAIRSISFEISFASPAEKEKAIGELNSIRKKIHQLKKEPEKVHKSSREGEKQKKKVKNIINMMSVDPISLEVGHGLLALIDPNQGAKLMERVNSIRTHIALETGLLLPGVRFSDNLNIKPNGYIIKIRNIEVAAGEIILDRLMAIGPEEKLTSLKGPLCYDPTYGMPAIWIKSEQRVKAEMSGCMIFDPVSVIATQLTEVIRSHAHELLGIQETKSLIENVKKTHPDLIAEIYPRLLSLIEIQKILKNLLKEKISIIDVVIILETLANYSVETKNTDILTEYARQALSRSICREYQDNEGMLNVITLSPDVENFILEIMESKNIDCNMKKDIEEIIIEPLKKKRENLINKEFCTGILCSSEIRLFLKTLTEKAFPNIPVLSDKEIDRKTTVKNIDTIELSKRKKSIFKKRYIFSYIDKMIKDKDPLIKCEAIKSLLAIADKHNIDKIYSYLDTGLKEEDEKVRLESAKAIRELCNKNLYYEIE